METDLRFLRLSELARVTRLPARWLLREADAGRIPCLRAGRRRMFSSEAVLKALAKRAGSPARHLSSSEGRR